MHLYLSRREKIGFDTDRSGYQRRGSTALAIGETVSKLSLALVNRFEIRGTIVRSAVAVSRAVSGAVVRGAVRGSTAAVRGRRRRNVRERRVGASNSKNKTFTSYTAFGIRRRFMANEPMKAFRGI